VANVVGREGLAFEAIVTIRRVRVYEVEGGLEETQQSTVKEVSDVRCNTKTGMYLLGTTHEMGNGRSHRAVP
jgi:hypothetical protein